MAQLTHKEKVKLAKKMLSKKDVQNGDTKFTSKAWKKRRDAIHKRVEKKRK